MDDKIRISLSIYNGDSNNTFEEDKSDVDPNQATTFVYNPHLSLALEQQRKRLPIFNNRNHILYLLEKYQTLVLVGETGCGKSTQVPQGTNFHWYKKAYKIMGPSSLCSKILVGLLFVVLVYFVYMDTSLYFRIQEFPLRRDAVNASTLDAEFFVSCDLSPICDVTVKSMMLDHPNHYLFSPLATLTDRLLGISQGESITPNMISGFHVLVAIASAKCISSDSLVSRRVGVALFALRSMLDDLDGHVARARKHVHGESSEIGSVGYFVDGMCDALGTVALLVGCLVFLRNNPPRRGYAPLPTTVPPLDPKEANLSTTYKSKVTSKKVVHKLGCLGAQMLLSSTAWNRYIALYQDLLERPNVTEAQAECQIRMLRSTLMWTVAWLWRLFNPHALLHAMLVAIFCDKLWEFLRAIQYVGFIILLSLICITEMHVQEVQTVIFKSNNNTTV